MAVLERGGRDDVVASAGAIGADRALYVLHTVDFAILIGERDFAATLADHLSLACVGSEQKRAGAAVALVQETHSPARAVQEVHTLERGDVGLSGATAIDDECSAIDGDLAGRLRLAREERRQDSERENDVVLHAQADYGFFLGQDNGCAVGAGYNF